MEPKKISCPKTKQWLGRKADYICLSYSSSADGKRVTIQKWHDDESCTIHCLKGNFWRPKTPAEAGHTFEKVTIPNCSISYAMEVARAMADRHF